MATKRDYYETLGVSKSASDSDLKSAYRKLAKQYHPDNNPGDAKAEARFKEVSEAYAILSDGDKKAAYDQYGHAAFEAGGGGGGGGGFGGFGGFGGGGFSVNMDDILRDFFGGGGGRRNGPMQGDDLQVRMSITFEEAVFGLKKDVQLPQHENCDNCKGTGAKPGTHPESCKDCNGTGQVRVQQQSLFGGVVQSVRTCATCRGEGKVVKEACTKCRGSGKVRVNKTVTINVPKGIDHGQTLRMRGMGEPGERGGPSGDLLVTIQVSPHKVFSRKGTHLYLEIPITFVQAALGDEISIPMLDGTTERYTIKPGTQPGTVVHLRGKGVPRMDNNRASGDLVVTLNVTVPTQMTDKQKDHLRAFNEAMGEEYTEHKQKWFEKLKKSLGM